MIGRQGLAGLRGDLRTLIALARPHPRRGRHAETLDAFYERQADGYDDFRARLLPGREELIGRLPLGAGITWVDLGGGTASNLEAAGERLGSLAAVYVVDLCTPLLDVARRRLRARGWTNVALVRADASSLPLPAGSADVVTCSYSLTMMPDWARVIEAARRLLAPGGVIGVVDFHVPAASPAAGRGRHWADERFWPWWFRHSGVHLDPAHLPALASVFEPLAAIERRTTLPYFPGSRVPYYLFVGRRTGDQD